MVDGYYLWSSTEQKPFELKRIILLICSLLNVDSSLPKILKEIHGETLNRYILYWERHSWGLLLSILALGWSRSAPGLLRPCQMDSGIQASNFNQPKGQTPPFGPCLGKALRGCLWRNPITKMKHFSWLGRPSNKNFGQHPISLHTWIFIGKKSTQNN